MVKTAAPAPSLTRTHLSSPRRRYAKARPSHTLAQRPDATAAPASSTARSIQLLLLLLLLGGAPAALPGAAAPAALAALMHEDSTSAAMAASPVAMKQDAKRT
jgi:hypothetical protein